MDFNEFVQAIKALKIDLNSCQKQQLNDYYQKLVENNQKFNLFSFDEQELWLKYFYHSIFVYRNVDFNKFKTCLDLGSGSGIPGIVLKIIFPHLHLTIIEANHKKTSFMTDLVKYLHLDNVIILSSRIEDIAPNKIDKFDFVTARAVAPLEQLLELTSPYAKIGGKLVLPKSKNYLSEIKDLKKELKILGCQLEHVDVQIDHNHTFSTLYIKKISKTPDIFPRKYHQIVKGFDYENKSK